MRDWVIIAVCAAPSSSDPGSDPGGRFCKQGGTKLGLAHVGAGLREVFPLLSAGQSNPEGWQKVAGGSFQGCRGNDHRFAGGNTVASRRAAKTVRTHVKPASQELDAALVL